MIRIIKPILIKKIESNINNHRKMEVNTLPGCDKNDNYNSLGWHTTGEKSVFAYNGVIERETDKTIDWNGLKSKNDHNHNQFKLNDINSYILFEINLINNKIKIICNAFNNDTKMVETSIPEKMLNENWENDKIKQFKIGLTVVDTCICTNANNKSCCV